MSRNNAFKTSLLFLGIILAAIILRTYVLGEKLFDVQTDDIAATASCPESSVSC